MSLQTISGSHKKYKPGQLLTVLGHIYRVCKSEDVIKTCYKCGLGYYDLGKCVVCIKNTGPDCYLKLIK